MPAPNVPAATPVPQNQQQAFLQNAQLPGIDMSSILQSIPPEHLAALGHLFQAGLFPLPPAQTPAGVPAQVNAPVLADALAAPLNGAATAQEVDPQTADREEGELEDAETVPQGVPNFLRPPPTGPRKRSVTDHAAQNRNNMDKRAKRQQSPPRKPKGHDRRKPEGRASSQASPPPRSPVLKKRARHEAAKTFVLTAYRAGLTFDDLAREVGDARMLRIIFKELGLNAPAETSQQTNAARTHAQGYTGKAAAASTQNSPVNTAASELAVKPAANRSSISNKAPAAAPVDRSAYLARLQAAKNKKNEVSGAATQTASLESPKATPAPVSVQAAASTAPATTRPTVPQPRKANVQTDLIRKRLEALKAEQARKREAERLASTTAALGSKKAEDTAAPVGQSIPSSLPDSPSSSGQPALRVSSAPSTRTASLATSAQSIQPSPFASQFPGLPGLFMTGVSTQPQTPITGSQHQASEHPPTKVSFSDAAIENGATSSLDSSVAPSARSSPVVHQTETAIEARPSTVPSVSHSGQATPRHPFKYDSNDDSVIIHVSDEEESELDDMDEDEGNAASPAKDTAFKTMKPGLLHDFPPPINGATTSAPGTPGASTPGGTAYQRKLQEIEEMNRRIAEMQKQPKKVKPTTSTASAPAPALSLPGLIGHYQASADSAAAPQPGEEQPDESKQRMEAGLSQLKEEAEIISDQRHAAHAAQAPASVQAHGQDASAPSDSDDAMDLSSGDDSDSSEDEAQPSAPDVPTVQSGVEEIDSAQSDVSMDVSSDSETSENSSDSSSDSEDEVGDEYEPAPATAVSGDIDSTPALPTALPRLEPQSVPSTLISKSQAGPQDADLAPELQPASRGQENATPEVCNP